MTLSSRRRGGEPDPGRARGQVAGGSRRACVVEGGPGRLRTPRAPLLQNSVALLALLRHFDSVRLFVQQFGCNGNLVRWALLPPFYSWGDKLERMNELL